MIQYTSFTVDQWLSSHERGDGEERPDIKDILPALAEMGLLDYETVRQRVAKVADIRVAVLDAAIENQRPKKYDSKNGSAVAFPDVVPWENPVGGATLLDEIAGLFRRYVILPQGAPEAIAAWAVATWLKKELFFAPILALLSPTKRSGKSLTLDILRLIVYRGLPTSGGGITPAVLFRVNDKFQPTLLIDEAEKLSGDDGAKELIGLLNLGYRRGATVQRCAGDDHEVQCFEAFGFRSVAAIGMLWDTILDRSIVIRMARKDPKTKVERFSSRAVGADGEILSRKIARWVHDNQAAVADIESKAPRPGWLNDRACDNWSPLFAVGTIAGAGWLARLLDAAKRLQPAAEDEADRGEMLLRDIKGVFESEGSPEAIESKKLVSALNEIQTSPWGDNRGTGLTTHSLARRLRPFDISPRLSRIDGGQPIRAYLFETFQEAFSRYVTPNQSVTALQPAPVAEIMRFQSVTEDSVCNGSKLIKSLIDADCNTVTLQSRGKGGENNNEDALPLFSNEEEIPLEVDQ